VAKKFLLGVERIVVLSAAIAIPCIGFGTDPVVRQYLRNIDEDPKGERVSAEVANNELESLFESPSFIPPSEFRGAETRRWRDNTGAYEVEARLIIIYPDKVRLRKENGRTTTVAMRRLSDFDQAYVRWVADHMIRSGGALDAAD
jgi:hypothetical protein